MDWKKLIFDLSTAGMTQAEIASVCGRSQTWVSGVLSGELCAKDVKWTVGEALRAEHERRFGRKRA